MLGNGDADDGCGRAGGGEPHDGVLPVVTMAQTRAWGVLGHVPRVHDGVAAVVGGGAGVDLAGGAGAAAGGGARGGETATGRC